MVQVCSTLVILRQRAELTQAILRAWSKLRLGTYEHYLIAYQHERETGTYVGTLLRYANIRTLTMVRVRRACDHRLQEEGAAVIDHVQST